MEVQMVDMAVVVAATGVMSGISFGIAKIMQKSTSKEIKQSKENIRVEIKSRDMLGYLS